MKKGINIALFGGSFNPLHLGHLALANYVVEFTTIDEVWFVLSPQNPLKTVPQTNEEVRLEMIRIAIEGFPKFKLCNIELSLPKPNYTIHTLEALKKDFQEDRFSLLIGADNLATFSKWKEHKRILEEYQLLVYPRVGFEKNTFIHPHIQYIHAPLIEISSTFIRESIAKGKEMRFFLPEKIVTIIQKQNLYR